MAATVRSEPTHDKDFSDFQSPHEASVERLIRAVDRAYHRPYLMMWRAFLQGFMGVLGAVAGTIFISIVSVYIIQALGGLSLFKPYVDKLQQTSGASIDQKLKPAAERVAP